ncbi:hypothetical protein J3R83DRAFT_13208 [Lanmaoa asiatica]|nr:hypothetical protein J3R83DRAFT_13208 [Lanmaoa asiatica]
MSFTLPVGDLCLLILAAALALATCYVLADLIALLRRQHFSPHAASSWPTQPIVSLWKPARDVQYNQENTGLLYDWDATYGSTYAYKGFFKPDFVRDNLAAMGAGDEGLFTTEGDRVASLFFIIAQFLILIKRDKASGLRDVWILPSKDHSKSTNVLIWLSRATLDVIRIAGFGYHFSALSGESDELADAYQLIFTTAKKFQLRTILETWIPLLRKFRTHSEAM